MLTVSNVVKRHGNRIILNEISFSVPKGQIVTLIGPSGGGKSTMLRCINGLDSYDSGSIDLKQLPRHKIGMVFQHFNLFSNMTVLENTIYAPIKILRHEKERVIAIATKWLERVGLADLRHTYIHRLSGGQKQRIAIVRALCMEPEIILFDEPTSALDPENVKEVLDVIKSLAYTGITMLIVTHAMKFANCIADRVLFLDRGEIIEDNNAKQFFQMPSTTRAKEFLNVVLHSD